MFCPRRCDPQQTATSSDLDSGVSIAASVHLPPVATGTGKRYYAFTTPAQRQGAAPFVVSGWQNTLAWLGGLWAGRGTAPKGFADLESAINHTIDRCRVTRVVVECGAPVTNVDK